MNEVRPEGWLAHGYTEVSTVRKADVISAALGASSSPAG